MTLIITIDEGEEIFSHVDRISYRGGWSFEGGERSYLHPEVCVRCDGSWATVIFYSDKDCKRKYMKIRKAIKHGKRVLNIYAKEIRSKL